MIMNSDTSLNRKSKTFQDLLVWQKSHRLALEVYSITNDFPPNEIYCLTSQMRRAAISVPANIAEGFRKKSKPDKLRFLNIAHGSLDELRYYLILSHDLGYSGSDNTAFLIEEVSKLIEGYSNGIRNSE
jgi:four helix bundle protein